METKARDPYLDEDHLYNKYELMKMANERNMKEKFEFKKRVEELEAALQGARTHAEVMEHKATRVNSMLRDRDAENKKLREALGFYANWANWRDGKICETDITPVEFHGLPNFFQDIGGKKARQALGEVGE